MATRTTKTPKTAPVPVVEANGVAPATAENMTLAEASAWFRVSEDGLRADAVAGRVPARWVGGEWRFNKPALVAWMSVPEPPCDRPKTGAELVERMRQIREQSGFQETAEEAEEFIRKVYERRKADSVAG